jgi:AcrR family transcriptional regulator
MSPTRRELVRATRARIIEAAARLTRERGASGFSMDVLAKEAGVARATVYEHFRSKRAVLDELASSISRSVTMEESKSATADPLVALRDLLGAVCRHWAEHEERMNGLRTLTALTGGEQGTDSIDERQLRRLVESLAAGGQMRGHWTVDEATDALGALTSYDTYERLRRGRRTPEEVEGVLAKLVVSIVSRGSTSPQVSGTSAETVAAGRT